MRINRTRSKGLTAQEASRLGKKVVSNSHIICGKGGRKTLRKDVRAPKSVGVAPIDLFFDPNEIKITTPWSNYEEQIDVSIIIPMYKSKEVIKNQINAWDFTKDGLTKEVIYVDDCCPEQSAIVVMNEWSRKSQVPNIQIIKHETNGGFSSTCNAGAKVAKGRYLIFLNADTIVSPNWVFPMIELLKLPDVGLVGNLQIRPDGTVDSAGSEWSNEDKSFPHIGRNIYHGKLLDKPFLLSQLPNDLKQVGEREMVTAACIAVEREVFFQVMGFDTEYRIGYWEDTDLNMKIRQAGYKIMYTPHSCITHCVGNSKSYGHRYISHNRNRFKNKWIDTGLLGSWIPSSATRKKVTNLKNHFSGKVVGCAVVCNDAKYLEACVTSASRLVDEWIIVVGGNERALTIGMCDSQGFPTDNTLSVAKNLVSTYGGQVIEPPGRLWKNEIEMHNAYASLLQPGEWMFKSEGSEVYTIEQLWKTAELMRQHELLFTQSWNFWNNVNTIGIGKWETPQERIIKWKQGYHYLDSLFVVNDTKKFVKDSVPCYRGKEKLFYNYAWVQPNKKIKQKVDYLQLDGTRYLEDVFLTWRKNPTLIQGRTHPTGGGETKPYNGLHPYEIQKLIDTGEVNFY